MLFVFFQGVPEFCEDTALPRRGSNEVLGAKDKEPLQSFWTQKMPKTYRIRFGSGSKGDIYFQQLYTKTML